jgi:hypothetical protein
MYGDATKYGVARTSYGGATSKLASLSFTNLNVTGLVRNATTGTYSGTIATPGGVVPGGAATMTPNTPFKFTCGNTGDVKDVYGSAQFVGLGFLTFSTISASTDTMPLGHGCMRVRGMLMRLCVAAPRPSARAVFIEVFGSPFLRNCSCVLGLLWGYAAAAWSRHGHVRYVPLTIMNASPGITFLWVKAPFFKLGFYPPLISASTRHRLLLRTHHHRVVRALTQTGNLSVRAHHSSAVHHLHGACPERAHACISH